MCLKFFIYWLFCRLTPLMRINHTLNITLTQDMYLTFTITVTRTTNTTSNISTTCNITLHITITHNMTHNTSRVHTIRVCIISLALLNSLIPVLVYRILRVPLIWTFIFRHPNIFDTTSGYTIIITMSINHMDEFTCNHTIDLNRTLYNNLITTYYA